MAELAAYDDHIEKSHAMWDDFIAKTQKSLNQLQDEIAGAHAQIKKINDTVDEFSKQVADGTLKEGTPEAWETIFGHMRGYAAVVQSEIDYKENLCKTLQGDISNAFKKKKELDEQEFEFTVMVPVPDPEVVSIEKLIDTKFEDPLLVELQWGVRNHWKEIKSVKVRITELREWMDKSTRVEKLAQLCVEKY